jgi:hypothetical protein
MEMPKPTDAHRKLQSLVGVWRGEEKMFPPGDPKGVIVVSHVNNRSALDGLAVIQDYEVTMNGIVNFRGHGIFTWDPTLQLYVLYWFDSMEPAANILQGSFDNKKLAVSNKSQEGYTRASWEIISDNSYVYKLESSGDGNQWQAMVEGTYSRIG